MNQETIFSKIIRREIPANIVFENERMLAFRDIQPVADTHILLIPKKQIVDISKADENDKELLGEMLLQAAAIAREQGLEESGYRFVINTGADGGQTVFHLHMHILGGREMKWPPG